MSSAIWDAFSSVPGLAIFHFFLLANFVEKLLNREYKRLIPLNSPA